MYRCYEWIYGIPFCDLKEDSIELQLSTDAKEEWFDFLEGVLVDTAPYTGYCESTNWFGVRLNGWDDMDKPIPEPNLTDNIEKRYGEELNKSKKEFPLFWKEFEEKFSEYYTPRMFILKSTS